MSQDTYTRGTGRRKCAIAQVKLLPGRGAIIVNGKPYEERFPRILYRNDIERPLLITDTRNKFNIEVKVVGGGITGQAEAIRHGIARALVEVNSEFKPVLKKDGLLTRDPRIKERKKYGLKRARKAPQYTKR